MTEPSKSPITNSFSKSDDENTSSHRELTIHYSACAFIDILGQQAQLKNLDAYNLGPELANDPAFQKAVRETIGRVNHLHDSLYKFFDAFREAKGHSVPEEHTQYWANLTDINLHLIPFSDGFFLSVPLVQDKEIIPLYGVASLFHSLSAMMLQQLAMKTAIRGGVEIGTEVQLRENVSYGSGVSKAYDLESNTAVYPRIVVGKDLVAHIAQMATLTPVQAAEIPYVTNHDLYAKLTSKLAKICQQLLIIDFDGNAVVHYLSPYVINGIEDETFQKTLIREGYTFAVEQAKAARNAKDTKIALKYNHLLQYFEKFGLPILAQGNNG